MDYKYIDQLLNRYWKGNTSLEEEEILRAFFSQKDIPQSLMEYRELFVYQQTAKETDALDAGFDDKMMALIGERIPVRARKITFASRLMPLFKAAAMVAIILTLGNAMQNSFDTGNRNANPENVSGTSVERGEAFAMTDSTVIDTMNQSKLSPEELQMRVN